MSEKIFNVGDRVKIEGILEANNTDGNTYKLALNINGTILSFTRDGKFNSENGPTLQMVEKFVPKEAYYNILYENNTSIRYDLSLQVSLGKYKDQIHFENKNPSKKFMQLLESTKEMM